MAQQAMSIALADSKEAGYGIDGDPDAKLVVPQAWPFAGDIEQPPPDYHPPAESLPPESLPRFHGQPNHRPAVNRNLYIRPRAASGENRAANPGNGGVVNPVVPDPWPFVQPKGNSVAGTSAPAGRTRRSSGIPLWPLSSDQREQASERIEFGATPLDQPPFESGRQVLPGAVPNPVPLDVVAEEQAVFPSSERSDEGELKRQQRECQWESQRLSGQHTPPGDIAPVPTDQSRSSDITGRGRDIPSTSLNVIGRHDDEHVGYGFDLAGKGAVHSAHAEFVEALSINADALDGERDKSHHAALIAGLRAMDESDDFARRGKPLEAAIDFRRLQQLHKTRVLAADDPEDLTPYVAMQRYFVFAEQQLAYAGGETPAASRALYGLGRIQPYLAGQAGPGNSLAGPKGIALHRAALKANPRNHQAANELACLAGTLRPVVGRGQCLPTQSGRSSGSGSVA